MQEESDMERGKKGKGRSNVRQGRRGKSTAPRQNNDTLIVGRS